MAMKTLARGLRAAPVNEEMFSLLGNALFKERAEKAQSDSKIFKHLEKASSLKHFHITMTCVRSEHD